jgi:hypothetical protein
MTTFSTLLKRFGFPKTKTAYYTRCRQERIVGNGDKGAFTLMKMIVIASSISSLTEAAAAFERH